ncbi:DNA repair protein xrcc3 [Tieghemiomyces parasiticus]|uniref:DNA repair protein xrcc3 n=1 Tax=Tieghemiomyces parasiticus TaxID=78921 RepID=A0A9W7ZLF9_9FUNG|nr:DNA repair protein xrcc3 [Tieghemiomyces parasiticus]
MAKPNHLTARDLLARQRFLTTGDTALDRVLEGGIPAWGLTEIAGTSASGKTQLCLQLSLTAQLPIALGGLDGEVVYFSTEDAFPSRRLAELADIFTQRYAQQLGSIEQPDGPTKEEVHGKQQQQQWQATWNPRDHVWTDHIFLSHLPDLDTQDHILTYQLPVLLARGRVKLVVIDSIAANIRAEEFNAQEQMRRTNAPPVNFYHERQHHLNRLALRLKRWSEEYGVAVVCVNQVSDIVGVSGDGNHHQRGETCIFNGGDVMAAATWLQQPQQQQQRSRPSERIRPALGFSWTQSVNTRLLLTRPLHPVGDQAMVGNGSDVDQAVATRQLEVVFAPHLPNQLVTCQIRRDGVTVLEKVS